MLEQNILGILDSEFLVDHIEIFLHSLSMYALVLYFNRNDITIQSNVKSVFILKSSP